MSRSRHKLPFLNKEVLLKSLQKKKKRKYIFFQRNSKLPFFFINRTLSIHQGKFFKSYRFFKIQLGFFLGEFTITRRRPKHTNQIKIVKKVKSKNKSKSRILNFTKKGYFL